MKGIYAHELTRGIVRAAVILVIGMLLARVIPKRLKWSSVPAQRLFLLQKIVRYGLVGLTAVWVLRELGFNLSVLLGAAGIFTVAIGFASQTSASNLISGLLLIGERPFGVGDLVRVADVTPERCCPSTRSRGRRDVAATGPDRVVTAVRPVSVSHGDLRALTAPTSLQPEAPERCSEWRQRAR